MAGINTDLIIEDDGWGDEDRWQRLADRVVAATLKAIPETVLDGSELALVLTNDADIRDLNRDHRNEDKPTNVLSFPQHEPGDEEFGPLLGDIVIARETVDREAKAAGISLDHHVTHMIVHGLLHLFGYDHIEDDAADDMEALETAILAGLGLADPYAESREN